MNDSYLYLSQKMPYLYHMAKLESNAMIESLSGRLGGIVLKKYKYGIVISKLPDRSKVKPTKKVKQLNNTFRDAVKYAKSVLANPQLQKQYQRKLKTGKSLYHLALSDYLKSHKK